MQVPPSRPAPMGLAPLPSTPASNHPHNASRPQQAELTLAQLVAETSTQRNTAAELWEWGCLWHRFDDTMIQVYSKFTRNPPNPAVAISWPAATGSWRVVPCIGAVGWHECSYHEG